MANNLQRISWTFWLGYCNAKSKITQEIARTFEKNEQVYA